LEQTDPLPKQEKKGGGDDAQVQLLEYILWMMTLDFFRMVMAMGTVTETVTAMEAMIMMISSSSLISQCKRDD
jgi:hypothetical protein